MPIFPLARNLAHPAKPRTRAAWDAFVHCQAEDEAQGYKWWEDPEHPDYEDGGVAAPVPDDEAIPLP
ncbi:MAG: hypothetical protein EX262_00750, partial [Sphingomonadaceae bacterium]